MIDTSLDALVTTGYIAPSIAKEDGSLATVIYEDAKDVFLADSSWQNTDPDVQRHLTQLRQQGVQCVKWVSPSDLTISASSVCDTCLTNEGQIRMLGEPFETGVMIPPQHPNCLCTVEAVTLAQEDDGSLAALVQEYNQNHGADGKFSSTGDAHMVVAKDGTRSLGQAHPDYKGSSASSSGPRTSATHDLEEALQGTKTLEDAMHNPQLLFESDRARGDTFLNRIQSHQGFDGLPHVVSEADLQQLIANGHHEIFRGEKEVAYTDHFMHGSTFYAGALNSLGNGMCTAIGPDARTLASNYAGNTGAFVHMALSPNARIINLDAIRTISDASYAKYDTLLASATQRGDHAAIAKYTVLREISTDNGRLAASLGYDAIHATKRGIMTILNRSVVSVSSNILTNPK